MFPISHPANRPFTSLHAILALALPRREDLFDTPIEPPLRQAQSRSAYSVIARSNAAQDHDNKVPHSKAAGVSAFLTVQILRIAPLYVRFEHINKILHTVNMFCARET